MKDLLHRIVIFNTMQGIGEDMKEMPAMHSDQKIVVRFWYSLLFPHSDGEACIAFWSDPKMTSRVFTVISALFRGVAVFIGVLSGIDCVDWQRIVVDDRHLSCLLGEA